MERLTDIALGRACRSSRISASGSGRRAFDALPAAIRARDTAGTMSQENVEAAKRANAALNRGDFEGMAEVFAPDAVLEDLQNAPDQPVRVKGVGAIRANLSLWAAAFDRLHAEIEEYIETPNEWSARRTGRDRERQAASP